MENNRGQSIFLSVVGVATLLVAIVGATFAFFSIRVDGNENASSITVQTADVGGVMYVSTSDKVELTNVYPGWYLGNGDTAGNPIAFTIATTNLGNGQTVDYTIDLRVTTPNDATNLAVAADDDTKEFYYTLTGTTGVNSGAVATKGKTDMPEQTTTGGIIGTGTLVGTETHSYVMVIGIEETGEKQDDLQALSYAASVVVEVAGGDAQRTYDAENINGEHWKTWTVAP